MFGRKSEEEKLFERIDKADAYVKKLLASGFPGTDFVEQFARDLRTNSFAFKGLAARTMVLVAQVNDPVVLEKWEGMWEGMKTGTLHSRDLKAFHDSLIKKS